MQTQLLIRHRGFQDDQPLFDVQRLSDGKQTSPVTLSPPDRIAVEGRPNSDLSQDLRWYLEKFLELPLGAYPETAERIQAALKAWGTECFETLFDKQARDWFQDARRHGLKHLTLKIVSDDPGILAWPWEALHDPDGGTPAHDCRLERQLYGLHDPLPLPENLPKEQINILLVIARPYGDADVGYHVVSRPLVSLAREPDTPVRIDVLRPPTFDRLRQVLQEHPGFYHIVHFDGHGGYGVPGHTSPHAFRGTRGMLVFEDEQAEPSEVDATLLSSLLAEYRIPIMVLNACQSAKIDEGAEDAFASVAAALLKAGIRSVVAMGHNLFVSGAQQFVPAFYHRLFACGDVAEATRAGRQAMLAHPGRVCAVGTHPLQDWLVPVLYQQLPPGEAVLPRFAPEKAAFDFSQPPVETLPPEARMQGDYGFIGRERAIQALERARLRQPQAAFLIHGMAGIGKTTLARGFLQWLDETHGLEPTLPGGGVFWFGFETIRSADYVIDTMVDALFGTDARAAPPEQKFDALVAKLQTHPFVLVWDNFESASGIAGTEVTALLSDTDRTRLLTLLQRLRGKRTRVLITSRAPESWLPMQVCYRLPLGGLQGEELWAYCDAVVRDLGLKVDRHDPHFFDLVSALDGNPLALRAVLLRLSQQGAAELLDALKAAFRGHPADAATARIDAALHLFDAGVPERFTPALQLIGLHEQHVVLNHLVIMLQTSEDDEGDAQACCALLESAGLLQDRGERLYRMHPALHGYLSHRHPASEARQRAFAHLMGQAADSVTNEPLHAQRGLFAVYGANFHRAAATAQSLEMDRSVTALLWSLAMYAQNTRDYGSAERLLDDLASQAKRQGDIEEEIRSYGQRGSVAEEQRDFQAAKSWYMRVLELCETVDDESIPAITYHQLGRIAQEQRDFDAAEDWYRKSLTIKEKLGDEHGAAITYHQLGMIAQEQRDLDAAADWYRKSLAITERLGDEHGAASTYHQLGMIAQKQRDFDAAADWYRKSLAIKEKLGNEHGAASTYHQLGSVAQEQHDFDAAATSYLRAIVILARSHDPSSTTIAIGSFIRMLHAADTPLQATLRRRWEEAGLDALITLETWEKHLNENR